MNWEITTFIAYFVILLGVALVFYFNGTNKNSEDFFLGGRSMGPWVTALSAQASDMSAWLLMGLPGSILAFGFGQMWIGIGLAIGTAANWILCAKRLRTFSKAANDSITLPQYLTNRFAVDSRALQLVCALIFLFAYTIYVASALVAGTSVFTTLFPDISPKIAMFAFLLIIVAYTFFGGFAAVCWTDFFQGLLMMAALMLVPIVVYFGHSELLDPTALETVYEYTDAATGAVTQCAFGGGIFNASWQDIVSGLGWGLGYFGMPHILVRFMSIEKPSMIKKSSIVAIIWVVISLFSAVMIAYFGRMIMGEELLTHGNQTAISNMKVELKGEGSSVQVISRSVAQDDSVQVFNPLVIGECACRGHVQCDAIIMGNAKVKAIPGIEAASEDALLVHEAAIGKIAGDQIVKLMTLGLTEEEAEQEILEDFLN